jgi:CRP/FNR family transcriptional regulator, cyclic AMP receptor protein
LGQKSVADLHIELEPTVAAALPIYELAARAKAWPSRLPAPLRAALVQRARPRSLKAGQRLYSRSDIADGFYLVKTGAIRVSGVSGGGRETVLDFYGPEVWFGEVSMLDGLPRTHDAYAYGPAALLQLAAGEFEEMLATHPAFAREILRLAGLRMRLLLTALESYSSKPLEHRLANRLLLLAVSFAAPDERGLKIELQLPQEILAQLIGSTRQRVNQILNAWETDGLVSHHYGKMVLLNQTRLKAMTLE